MKALGWKELMASCRFAEKGKYPIAAYSEFMPPVRVGCKPYHDGTADFFLPEDLDGWPVTEFEEAFQLRPGLEIIGRQIVNELKQASRGETAERLSRNKLAGNPFWPPELAGRLKNLKHERFVVILPLALSITQDDKGRKRWTLFGGSEQGPSRPFWKSFSRISCNATTDEEALDFIRILLNAAYGEAMENLRDLVKAGFRVLHTGEGTKGDLLPGWTSPFLWRRDMSLRGVKYLLSYEPFGALPKTVKSAYLEGRLNLIPFPGSLALWGVPGFLQLQSELPTALQIPLQHMVERHEAPYGLRVPQSGWFHVPGPDHPVPHTDFGPIRHMFRRTHRWERVHLHEDDLAKPGREDPVLHVLFSTAPDDVGLYGKPMARNCHIWTQEHRLLLDGPNATRRDIQTALQRIEQGGMFGYRFQYPAMCVGDYEVYWHRPLVAYLSGGSDDPVVLPDAPLGYLTAYPGPKLNPARAVELRPRLLRRDAETMAVEAFKDRRHEHKTINRVFNLLRASEDFPARQLPLTFARQVMMLPRRHTLERFLETLPEPDGKGYSGPSLQRQLRGRIEPKERELRAAKGKPAPEFLTFDRTARRSFEVQYWKDMSFLSAGIFINKANPDCVTDPLTQKRLKHHHRDLEPLGDYLLDHYRRLASAKGLERKALVGDLPFKWTTDFDFEWWGGWARNQSGSGEERNLMLVIPGRDRQRAVILADHYDTAYMEDLYYKEQGGSGVRLAAAGADDNHSATAALMRAGPIFCDLSRQGKLGCDIWLVHLTGEEFPSDCMGARHLCQALVEGTLRLRLQEGKEQDLSKVQVKGVFVMDMIAHNNDNEPDVFQISPGEGEQALRLAYQAHVANETWNACTRFWNRRSSRRGRGRGRRSPNKDAVPAIARHPVLEGQIRLPRDPQSTVFNTDARIFSDAGIPVVLIMENYDINRKGYHDTHDTMANIDLDYGAALAAIAIEATARATTQTRGRSRAACGRSS
jgi:hypothetical protein